ncbi:hypothetical protein DFR58_102186 [Anaerobacterium chartisolvens]|uniref:DUF6036 domain-containing protein n=1 Tax=Anaerobacterium chartisolvens TaxID=1297424 RepID=A0A369BHS7_9FIRM|nr:DUF6036 family nucleotidyltransferase [Anaerobacterium chartisolvens]RCX20116.1 hypothetical protein DFR58_102186 [Anaerobacterium chartisolvens]
MENKSRDILIQILRDMDDFAEMKGIDYPPIYLLGGSGCIVGEYLSRATTDFDLLDMEYASSMGRLLRILDRYDFLDLCLTTIPQDFTSRAKKIQDYKNVFVLSREDIILSKVGRYSQKDIEDISILIEKADRALLAELIDKVVNREDLAERVKSAFTVNLKLFRESFYV